MGGWYGENKQPILCEYQNWLVNAFVNDLRGLASLTNRSMAEAFAQVKNEKTDKSSAFFGLVGYGFATATGE